ncbi:MAG: hypothetical protein Q8P17_05000 [bacterium]|nr:hypothetical protein [bacterium]
MAVQLVSPASGPKRVKYLQLDEIVCLTGHWKVLRELEAMFINLRKKLAETAIFVSTNPDKDERRFFIPSVYVGVPNRDGIFTESALIGNAFPRIEVSKGEYGIYLRYFVREQFVKFFAQTIACAGIKTLFFKNGALTPNAVMVFKDNGINVTRVDI